jgi:hypothetical protein
MLKVRHYAAGIALGLMGLVSGCADRPMTVPATANIVSEGNGDRVSYRVNDYGRVYITDQADQRIIYSGEVRPGDPVEVNAREDRILVGGHTVFDKPLDDGHQFRIYFEPGPRTVTEERVVRYRTVDEQPHDTTIVIPPK